MKKETPILFNTAMVQAILSGKKTQTRRLLKYQPISIDDFQHLRCPFGEVEDLLWVRETYAPVDGKNAIYKADLTEAMLNSNYIGDRKWKPSIFMPKFASRLWLKITSVNSEQIQNITEDQCLAEGIQAAEFDETLYPDYLNPGQYYLHAYESFKSLWISINGEKAWNSNPWVWVVDFELISTECLAEKRKEAKHA